MQTKEQVTEAICVEHYTALPPSMPNKWITCHQPITLEDNIMVMEASMTAEAWGQPGESKCSGRELVG